MEIIVCNALVDEQKSPQINMRHPSFYPLLIDKTGTKKGIITPPCH